MIFTGFLGGGPASLSYEGGASSADPTTAEVRTHTSVPVGAADADRTVFIIAHWVTNISTVLSSATIGGAAATIHVQTNNVNRGVAILSARLAAGTTTTVVLTLAVGAASYGTIVASFRSVGLVSAAPYDTDSAIPATVPTQAVTLDLKGDGILLAAATLNSLAAAYGMSGATEQYEVMPTYVGGGDAISADEAARVITFSRSGGTGTNFSGAVVAASFR